MAIFDPTDIVSSKSTHVGDILPSDTATKLGHHSAEHQEEEKKEKKKPEKNFNPLRSKRLDPVWNGLNKIPENAWTGMKLLGLFALVFTGVSYGSEQLFQTFLEGIPTGAHKLAMILLSVVPTGAIYFGAKGFFEGMAEAKEHNEKIEKKQQTADISEQVSQQKTHHYGAPEQGIIAIIGSIPAAYSTAEQQAEQQQQAAFLSRILESGPNRLTPAELAERLTRERQAAATQQV